MNASVDAFHLAQPPLTAQAVVARLEQRHSQELQKHGSALVPVNSGQWIARRSGMPLADLATWRTDAVDTALITFAEGQHRMCAAMRINANSVRIVLADPFDRSTRVWVEGRIRAAGSPATQWCVAAPAELIAFFARLEREMRALDVEMQELPTMEQQADEADVLTLSLADISADESPIVRFVNSTLYDALKAKASDIHLECAARGLVVKYRLDGVLQTITRMDGREFADRTISRIKVLADLDRSEERRVGKECA